MLDNVETLLVLGDTHGNTFWVQQAILTAQEQGITKIVQVGDWGYWEHTGGGQSFLKQINVSARKAGVSIYWLDGNHENHPMLWEKYTETTDEGFVKIRSNIFYLPRGLSWTWAGVKFLAVGGACSIDRALRIPGKSWWAEEQITDQNVAKAAEAGIVDVLLTHEAPNDFLGAANFELIHDDMSLASRLMIGKVAQASRPRVWIHGHMHYRVNYKFRHADGWSTVVALACDNMNGSFVLLELPSLDVLTPR